MPLVDCGTGVTCLKANLFPSANTQREPFVARLSCAAMPSLVYGQSVEAQGAKAGHTRYLVNSLLEELGHDDIGAILVDIVDCLFYGQLIARCKVALDEDFVAVFAINLAKHERVAFPEDRVFEDIIADASLNCRSADMVRLAKRHDACPG